MFEMLIEFRDFLHAFHVAQGTQCVGAAARNLVDLTSQFFADTVHFFIDFIIAVRIHETNFHTHQVVKNLVALSFGNPSFFQHQDAVHAQALCAGCGQHSVVALCLTGGHHQVIAFRLGICQQEFQLSYFVSAQCHTAQIVSLNPYVGTQFTADVRQTVKRGRENP